MQTSKVINNAPFPGSEQAKKQRLKEAGRTPEYTDPVLRSYPAAIHYIQRFKSTSSKRWLREAIATISKVHCAPRKQVRKDIGA